MYKFIFLLIFFLYGCSSFNTEPKFKISVFEDDVNNFANINQITKNKFDIIFIDPPYKEKNIGLILQDSFLFSDTIFNNINFFSNKNDHEILSILKKIQDKLN